MKNELSSSLVIQIHSHILCSSMLLINYYQGSVYAICCIQPLKAQTTLRPVHNGKKNNKENCQYYSQSDLWPSLCTFKSSSEERNLGKKSIIKCLCQDFDVLYLLPRNNNVEFKWARRIKVDSHELWMWWEEVFRLTHLVAYHNRLTQNSNFNCLYKQLE